MPQGRPQGRPQGMPQGRPTCTRTNIADKWGVAAPTKMFQENLRALRPGATSSKGKEGRGEEGAPVFGGVRVWWGVKMDEGAKSMSMGCGHDQEGVLGDMSLGKEGRTRAMFRAMLGDGGVSSREA